MAKKALDRGADVVLVCGGDGTVRAASQALVGTEAALAVFPTGTANGFASAMSIPDDPAGVVELIRSGARRVIDTGTCNGLTFNVMAGAGFDAAMIDSADEHKDRMGMVAYLRAGVKQAREREAFEMRVEVDDKQVFEGRASCVLVGNIGTLKGGIEAFPDASPTDGVLDVAVVTATGLKAWTGLVVGTVRGRQHLTGHAHMSVRAIGLRALRLQTPLRARRRRQGHGEEARVRGGASLAHRLRSTLTPARTRGRRAREVPAVSTPESRCACQAAGCMLAKLAYDAAAAA